MTRSNDTRRSWILTITATATLGLGGCYPEEVAIELPGTDLHPEGIARSSDGSLYVGSITDGSILRITPSQHGSQVDVFSSGALTRGAVGMTLDELAGVLLVCDASPFEPSASALVALDLGSGQAVATHPLEPTAPGLPVLCNDVIQDEDGTVYLTESFGSRILRLSGDQVLADGVPAEPWLADDTLAPIGDPPFGANGIDVFEGELYAVNFNQGTLVRVPRSEAGEPLTPVVISLTDEAGMPTSLVGPDGIAASSDGHLLVVENGLFAGGGGNRLSAIDIDGDTGEVSIVVDGLDSPTTVAQGEHYNWVVEAQFDHLFGLDPAPAEPFVLLGFRR
ncbi:MAG: hypothetical protein AAGF11_38575 [Myxococcota bacterium]